MLADAVTLHIDLWALIIAETIPAVLLFAGIVAVGWLLSRPLCRLGDQLAGIHRDTLGGLERVQNRIDGVQTRIDGVRDDVGELSKDVEVIRVQVGAASACANFRNSM